MGRWDKGTGTLFVTWSQGPPDLECVDREWETVWGALPILPFFQEITVTEPESIKISHSEAFSVGVLPVQCSEFI